MSERCIIRILQIGIQNNQFTISVNRDLKIEFVWERNVKTLKTERFYTCWTCCCTIVIAINLIRSTSTFILLLSASVLLLNFWSDTSFNRIIFEITGRHPYICNAEENDNINREMCSFRMFKRKRPRYKVHFNIVHYMYVLYLYIFFWYWIPFDWCSLFGACIQTQSRIAHTFIQYVYCIVYTLYLCLYIFRFLFDDTGSTCTYVQLYI